MKPFASRQVAAVFDGYPAKLRKRLLRLRQLIFDTAAATEGVGQLDETLKWGEPAYLTTQSKSGSTIRIDRLRPGDSHYAMYFNCNTSLVDTFRTLFSSGFSYQGNRAIVFDVDQDVPFEELSFCIAMALTYHRRGKGSGKGNAIRSGRKPAHG